MSEQAQQQCIFCGIANGQIPAKKVYEDDKITAVLDINPAVPGHILILTKQHVAIMPQLGDELIGHIGIVAKKLSHKILGSLDAEGTSIFIANGAAAGQRAPHFMTHVIPRKEGDTIGLALEEKQFDEATMKETFAKLSATLARQAGKEAPTVQQPVQQTQKLSPEQEEDKKKLDDISKLLTGS